MLYAWIDGVKRPPTAKGERTACHDCGGTLTSVIPAENVRHWRHKTGDCDSWSEPEGPWHLGWKEAFPEDCREISLSDSITGERHRADVLCGAGTSNATVLELQHSSIPEDERIAREAFYQQDHRMFWLIHIHNHQKWNFGMSLNWQSKPVNVKGKEFAIMQWYGRSTQFIEKWKRSTAYVFFEFQEQIFFLAGKPLSEHIAGGTPLEKGQYALCHLTHEEFIRSASGA